MSIISIIAGSLTPPNKAMMRKMYLLASLVWAASCSNPQPEDTKAGTDTPASTTASVQYPYNMRYSSDFSMGDTSDAKIVMTLWKQFDENRLDESLGYFADSVMMIFPDGNTVNAGKDSVLAMTKAYRAEYSNVRSEVDVVLPVKENSKGDRWVLVWGEEYHEKAGKKDSALLHEVWMFNKAGKIAFMHQYAGKD